MIGFATFVLFIVVGTLSFMIGYHTGTQDTMRELRRSGDIE